MSRTETPHKDAENQADTEMSSLSRRVSCKPPSFTRRRFLVGTAAVAISAQPPLFAITRGRAFDSAFSVVFA